MVILISVQFQLQFDKICVMATYMLALPVSGLLAMITTLDSLIMYLNITVYDKML